MFLFSVKTKMYTTIFHISDIHIRLFSRRVEYASVFNQLYDFLRKHKKDDALVVVTGDILHNKIDLQPECTMSTYEFLRELGSIMPTIVIAGNHDALLNNRDRIDSLTSILYERHPPNVFYYSKTGVYRHDNVVFVVNSLLDDQPWLTGDTVEKKNITDIVIGLYHGQVYGWKNCHGYVSEHGERRVSDFVGCDIVMLGDIHKFQYMNTEKTIAYAGSLISQNFGETDEDHGVLVWSLADKTSSLVRLDNQYAYREYYISTDEGSIVFRSFGQQYTLETVPLPLYGNVKIYLSVKDKNDLRLLLRKKFPHVKFQFQACDDKIVDMDPLTHEKNITGSSHESLLLEYIHERWGQNSSDGSVERLKQELLADYVETCQTESASRMSWELTYVLFSHLFGYGPENMIDFTQFPVHTITGIFGKNSVGKSTLVDILSFLLYGKVTRSNHGNTIPREVIHFSEKEGWGEIGIKLGTQRYVLKKSCTRSGEKIKVVETLFHIDEHGQRTELTGEQRRKTDKIVQGIIGGYKTFVFTNLFLQQREESFRDMKQASRKDFLYELFGLDWFERYRHQKEEELKTKKTEIKLLANRVLNHSTETWKNIFLELETELDKTKNKIHEVKEKINEHQECREKLLLRLHPCQNENMNTALKKKSELEKQLKAAQTRILVLEKERDECIGFLERNNVDDLKRQLDTIASDGSIKCSEPPHQLFLQYAPGYSSCTRQEWGAIYNKILDHVGKASDLHDQWKSQEHRHREEINGLLLSRPSFDPEMVLGDENEQCPETTTVDNDVQKNKIETQKLQEQLDQYSLPQETETMVSNLEDEVRLLDMITCSWNMLKERLATDEDVLYNKKCKSCMSNPHFLQRTELLNESNRLQSQMREKTKKCEELWKEILEHKEFSCCEGSSWTELVQKLKRHLSRLRQSHTTIMKRLEELRRDYDNLKILSERVQHSQAFRKTRQIDTKIARLEKQMATDPIKKKHETAMMYVRDLSVYQAIHALWSTQSSLLHCNPVKLEQLVQQCIETAKKRDTLIARCYELGEQIVSLRIALDKLNDEIMWLAENEKIHRQIDSLTKEYDDNQKTLSLFEEAYQKTDRTLVNQRVMYDEWQRDNEQYTQACEGSKFLELVIKTTERDGLPLFMLKRKLPLIEDDVNALLSPFLDKKLVLCVDEKDVIVGVETSVSTKKKNVISNYLGGMESFVIDLSLKLGFSKFANLPRSNFFIIDEGISVMDQERLSNISHMFDFLSNITDHVLLISHIPSIKDFVHRSIDIMKDETTQKSRLLIT